VELFVPDVKAAAQWYADTLGFEIVRFDPEESASPLFALTALGDAVVMFMNEGFYTGDREELASRGSGTDIRVMVPDVDAVYKRVRDAGGIIMHNIGDRDYGLRDFIMRDPDGFRLRFASRLG
jgi:catechol 2,3-dioxygenase-like lactoylglutathione lyase family enzyme